MNSNLDLILSAFQGLFPRLRLSTKRQAEPTLDSGYFRCLGVTANNFERYSAFNFYSRRFAARLDFLGGGGGLENREAGSSGLHLSYLLIASASLGRLLATCGAPAAASATSGDSRRRVHPQAGSEGRVPPVERLSCQACKSRIQSAYDGSKYAHNAKIKTSKEQRRRR